VVEGLGHCLRNEKTMKEVGERYTIGEGERKE